MYSLTATANSVQQWDDAYFLEYVRDNRFRRYMGTDENNVIVMKDELISKPGATITIPLVTKLNGNGVTGNTALEGAEEPLDNFGFPITISVLRNGVEITKWEQKKSAFSLREAAKTTLKMWSMEKLRDAIIIAMGSIDGTPYATATETAKDAWLVNNADRVLFGAVKANASSGDHSTSLGNVDNTADKLSPGIVSLAKRMAKATTTTGQAIRPIRIKEDEEWYVMFAPSQAFRDLKNDATMTQANREAWLRGEDNPLFRDGDLIWDGVIIREIPEIPILVGVGATLIDVAPCYFCGAQAVGIAWGQRPASTSQVTDYGFRSGLGIEEMRGVEKMRYNNKQHGMVTVYVAGVADA